MESYFAARKKFYNAEKEPNESVAQWIERMRALAKPCDFLVEKHAVSRDIFVIGFGPGPIQNRLFRQIELNNNISLTSLEELALEEEKMLLSQKTEVATEGTCKNITINNLPNGKNLQARNIQNVDNNKSNMKIQNNIIADKVVQTFDNPNCDPVLPFNLERKLSSFQGREQEMKTIYDLFEKNKCRIIVIHGLFGTGKSEFVNQFAWKYLEYYENNIIWIKYEDLEKINAMFITIAKEIYRKYNEHKPLIQVVNDVYTYFAKKDKSLFIFDDVLSRNLLNDYFPDDRYSNIRILITSPYAKWGKIETFNLPPLSEKETILILKSVTNNSPFLEELNDDLKDFLKVLNGMPLHIQMFASNIVNESFCIDKNYSFSNYISYLQKQNILNDKTFPKWSDQNIKKSVYTSFVTTIDRIKSLTENEDISNMALSILNFCAYFTSESIPYKLIKLYSNSSSNESDFSLLTDALRTLVDFSLIIDEENFIKMHKVMQNIILMHQEKCGTKSIWYKKVLEFILNYPESIDILENNIFSLAVEQKKAVFEVYKERKNPGNLIKLLNKYECQSTLDYILDPNKDNETKINRLKAIKDKKSRITYEFDDSNMVTKMHLSKNSSETDPPIHEAAVNGHLDVIKLLISNDDSLVYLPNTTKNIPFHIAGTAGHIHILKYFLEDHKVPVNICNESGSTVLHLAALNGKTDAISFLIDQGASIDARDDRGNTPLHYACQTLYLDTVKILIAKGTPIDVRNEKGDTPLHFAALIGKTEVVSYLIDEGADFRAVDDFNNNALHFSAQRGHVETTKKLIEQGCSPHIENDFGNTPLQLAVLKRQLLVVQVLCANGCRPDEVSEKDGLTPMSVASRNGHTEICSYFLKEFPDLYKRSDISS